MQLSMMLSIRRRLMSKRKDKRMLRRGEYEKPRTCDPGMCPNCEYLGDGNAICTRYNNVLVLSDWQITPNTLMCRRAKK